MIFPKPLLLLLFAHCMVAFSSHSQQPYVKNADGVILYPVAAGQTTAVRLQVLGDNIIRVTASPEKTFPAVKSFVVTYKNPSVPQWNLTRTGNNVELNTKLLRVVADTRSGNVVFYNRQGKKIIAEKETEDRLRQTMLEGERTYTIRQAFESSAEDAWYGLGQHQDGLMNYKGYQVLLFQNNTEVAVPFLVSKKNYGILWDNNSITQAGDVRPYNNLSSLKLFSKDNEPGWLTATYINNKNKPAEVLMKRAESEINYEFLNDSKLHLPAEFKPQDGAITWEGSIASTIDGIHKLRFTYGGYMKVWLDGKLLLDRWRQSWNPGSVILDVALEKDKKVPVKIEWIPDGGESYATAKWLPPVEAKEEHSFSFLSEAGQQSDYYFIYGKNMDDVIAGYRKLTGKATMLPVWTFGFWQSRERYRTQDEVLSTAAEFRKRKIPFDNIVQDWFYWKESDWGSQEFDASRFPNPDSMIKVIHDKHHARFMISVWPKFYEGINSYNDFDKKGWLYKRNIADRQKDWVGKGYVSTFYDVFNEGAQKGFWELIRDKLYAKGVDAWWMDASEPDILSNVSPAKRKQLMYPLAAGLTAENLNAYPLLNAKGIYEGQRSVDPNKRVFILTRSGFPGMQRYAAATWSGDISSRWHDMKLQISAGINFSMSGLPYWTMDIGGFATERRFNNPDTAAIEEWREMNARWHQFGAFVPLFRSHGQYPLREMYNMAPETHPCYQSMLYYDKLRYRLLPYIYSIAGKCYHDDYTMMRGLVMDFPEDDKVNNINDQYLFGPSLLVNPVYTYQERSRDVYLPKGTGWFDLYSGRHTEGGQTIRAEAPYEQMPLYVRAGSIIPFGPALQYTTEKKADTIILYVYAGRDAAFNLYEDEGITYNYERKIYSNIPISYSEKSKTLTIGNRTGEFPGMLTKRYFRVVLVSKEKAVPWDLDKEQGALVTYEGSQKRIVLK